MDRYFFSINKGLSRRFPWNYDISNYSTDNLINIFIHQVKENSWKFDIDLTNDNYKKLRIIFNEYSEMKVFDQNGGDTLVIFDKAKIIHSRRVFGQRRLTKKYLSESDIRKSMDMLKVIKKKKNKLSEPPFGMYL